MVKLFDTFEVDLPDYLNNQWAEFLILLAVWMLIGVLVMLAIRMLTHIALRTERTDVDEKVLSTVSGPVLLLVFGYGVIQSLRVLDAMPGWLVDNILHIYQVVVALIVVLAWSVLYPSKSALRSAPDLPTFSAEFEGVGNGLTDLLRKVGVSGPVTRASIRSIAASDPDLLEEALAFAGPSEALLAAAPSRDQVWGGRAYAASGLTGTGFAGNAVLGRGVPTAVSFAENTFSVYVLSEHGALGGLGILLAYLALLVVVGVWTYRVHETVQETRLGLAVLAMTVGGVSWLTLTAIYVAASNLALVPLTGQNMPFLGLNSWADVILVSGLGTGIVFGLAALDEPRAGGRES